MSNASMLCAKCGMSFVCDDLEDAVECCHCNTWQTGRRIKTSSVIKGTPINEPQPPPKVSAGIETHEGKKYLRAITPTALGMGIQTGQVWVDVYAVLVAFNVTCPARAHALKKIMACGQRGKGSELDDLRGAIAALNRAIELQEDRERTAK